MFFHLCEVVQIFQRESIFCNNISSGGSLLISSGRGEPILGGSFLPWQFHPLPDHIVNTHTNRWKLDWSLDHFNSSLQAKIHSCSQQAAIWLCWLSRKIRHAPPLKPTKTKPSFRKPSFNKTMHAFSNSPLGQGSYGHKPTPCHCPLNGANLHTFPLAQQAGPTSPKSHLSTAPLKTTVWWHLPSRMSLHFCSTLTNIQPHSSKVYTHK